MICVTLLLFICTVFKFIIVSVLWWIKIFIISSGFSLSPEPHSWRVSPGTNVLKYSVENVALGTVNVITISLLLRHPDVARKQARNHKRIARCLLRHWGTVVKRLLEYDFQQATNPVMGQSRRYDSSCWSVTVRLQIQYCILSIVFCNFLRKEVAVCFPGGADNQILVCHVGLWIGCRPTASTDVTF